MDYWTRLILAAAIGLGAGLLLGQFFGNYLFWLIISLAIALATETSLRTIKNVKAPPSPLKDQSQQDTEVKKKMPFSKPPKPRF